jgi:hypothetical protein
MPDNDDKTIMEEIDKGFDLLKTDPASEAAYQDMKQKDVQWKKTDPAGYKKDMEDMCKEMFGDNWEREYTLMLKEEFPEEFA